VISKINTFADIMTVNHISKPSRTIIVDYKKILKVLKIEIIFIKNLGLNFFECEWI